MFDKNPRTTPADKYVAGKTAEAIVRTVEAAMRGTKVIPVPFEGATIEPRDILAALVARYDRKAEAREAKAA